MGGARKLSSVSEEAKRKVLNEPGRRVKDNYTQELEKGHECNEMHLAIECFVCRALDAACGAEALAGQRSLASEATLQKARAIAQAVLRCERAR